MAVTEIRVSAVAEANELDSSNGSTDQQTSVILDAASGSKSRTPNLIEVERESSGWVRR